MRDNRRAARREVIDYFNSMSTSPIEIERMSISDVANPEDITQYHEQPLQKLYQIDIDALRSQLQGEQR